MTSMAKLEAERNRLRIDISSLFDQKRAIELQMEEISNRLQWLDDKIDGTGLGAGFTQTQTQHEDSTTTATATATAREASNRVKFEVIEEQKQQQQQQGGNSNSSKKRPPHSHPFTQPEDYLTDPQHTQQQAGGPEDYLTDPASQDDHYFDNHEFATAATAAIAPEKARRVSKSPPSPDIMYKSNTPPGLKRSSAPQQHDVYSSNHPAGDQGFMDNNSKSNNNMMNSSNINSNATNNNPFQDLWNSNETSHLNGQNSNSASSNVRKGGGSANGGVNTLEKYFCPQQSSANNTNNNNNNSSSMNSLSEMGSSNNAFQPSTNNNFAAARATSNNSVVQRQQINNPYSKSSSNQANTSRSTQNINSNNNNNNNNNNSNARRYPWTDRMMHHLRTTFNIPSFRGHQEEIINTTMNSQDAFVIMRTGGGKSLTYQLPAVLESESSRSQQQQRERVVRKVTVCISPLISLIRDQEDQMNAMRPGSATSFTSGIDGGTSEHARRWNLVRDPNAGIALIFVTPEKVGKSTKFKGEMEKLHGQGRLGRFVIDECHCACQWGHDFRPDYTKLGILKHHFPTIPVLAVTATASERVTQDCAQILRLGTSCQYFRSTANRPNLNYSVRCKQDSKDGVVKDMVAFIKQNHTNQAGIIYTFSKKEADDVANKLCNGGIVARSYHSGVNDTRKNQIQRSWMRNDTQVVVATIAFGLGINKPDVRFVLHHSLSKSLEAYYQESGRAGRDGKPANCVLFYSPKDVTRMLGMIHGEAGECTLWAMVRYGQAHGDDGVCRHTILAALGECDNTMPGTLENLQKKSLTAVRKEVGAHCQTAVKVVHALNMAGEDCTINQIVTKWRSKPTDGTFSFLRDNPPGKDLNKEDCERIIIYLMTEDVLTPKIVYTAYNSIVYITLRPQRGQKLLISANPRAEMNFPIRSSDQQQKASSKKSPTTRPAETDEDGWISRPQAGKKRKAAATKTKAASKSTKSKAKAAKGKKTTKKKATSKKLKKPTIDIVEINSSSSDSSDDEPLVQKRSATRKAAQKKDYAEGSTDDDSDCEFEG